MARTVLITGCSDGGLGAALAVAFHETKKFKVIATARNPAKMKELAALGITTLTLDVLSDDSVRSCVQEVSSITGGSLDMLVNNACAGYNMPVLDADIAETAKLFELNVFAPIRTIQHFFPLLRNSTQRPLIATNTSVNSVLGLPWQGPYNASKAAAAMISETLRIELQAFGIRSVDLKTGRVASNFFENVTAPKLPADSPYAAARDGIEKVMLEGPDFKAMPAATWAKRVVSDLSGNPAAQVWRGEGATMGRLASNLPIGLPDFEIKRASGVKEAEKKIKAAKKVN